MKLQINLIALLMDLTEVLEKVYPLSSSVIWVSFIEILFGLSNKGIELLCNSMGE